MHLFPYQHFVSATLSHAEDTEVLRVAFSSHDVEISGQNLRALLIALQDFAVKWMRALPERYQQLETGESGIISSIRVKELN